MRDRPSSHLGLYRHSITNADHRRYITVGREGIFHEAIEVLRKNAGRKPKHHTLYVAPRGFGKTHLLSLIEDKIAADEELSKNYVVARFPEESNRTLSFANFLLGLCEILCDALPGEPQWRDLLGELETEEDDRIVVDRLVPAIRERYRDTGSAIVVMMENLNKVFDDQIKDRSSIAALRGFFMNDNGCLLIATAPMNFGGVTDSKEPFYDFFDVQYLSQLSDEETIELIRRNLEWEEHPALENFSELRPKLLAIYRMTGGSPRLTLMLFELIAHEAVTEVVKQFTILLDRITPFYQDRMNDLGPQERAILETMAVIRREPRTPAAVAAKMRMKPRQVSTLLGRLVRDHYLRAVENPRDKRSRIYVFREGFFDIWLAMNVSRGERKRLPFLLEFFEGFYPSIEERNRKREELRKMLEAEEEASSKVREGDARESLDYLSAVGSGLEQVSEKLRLAGWYHGRGEQEWEQLYLREAKVGSVDEIGGWIVSRAGGGGSVDYLSEVEDLIACWEAHRDGGLEKFAEKLLEMGQGLSYASWSEAKIEFLKEHLELLSSGRDRVSIRLMLGQLLAELARWDESERLLKEALSEANVLNDCRVQMWALNEFGQLLHSVGHLEEAEEMMKVALSLSEANSTVDHPEVAICLNNLGILLTDTNRLEEAELFLKRALDMDRVNFGENHPVVALRMNNLGQVMQAANRLEEAEPLMKDSLSIHQEAYGTSHPQVAIDLNNLAQLLQETNRVEEAKPLLERALAIDESSYGKDHPKVAIRLNNLAQLLHDANRVREAEPLMKRALTIFSRSLGPDHPHTQVVSENLRLLLKRKGQSEDEAAKAVESILQDALSSR